MATIKNRATLAKRLKRRDRKIHSLTQKVADLQAKLKAAKATIKNLTSSAVVQNQPNSANELTWGFDEALKKLTKHLGDRGAVKATEHASASKMAVAPKPSSSICAPLDFGPHSVRTPTRQSPNARPESRVQMANSHSDQTLAHSKAKVAERTDEPTPRDKHRSSLSKGKDNTDHHHRPTTNTVQKGSAPLPGPFTLRESSKKKQSPKKGDEWGDDFYKMFYGT